MLIGIIPNIKKNKIEEIVEKLVEHIVINQLDYIISEAMLTSYPHMLDKYSRDKFVNVDDLANKCDIVISIGGDGTMLNCAFKTRQASTPLAGVNFGKLGFLAEHDINGIEELINDIKNNNYTIEERMALAARCNDVNESKLYAINDIVIDKGPWPKMIQLTIKVDGSYVSTFSADGLIIATPTGSTGYSLSTGGPIVTPKNKAIVLSPISPHTLTMRPLVVSEAQKVEITAESLHKSIHVNSDGQRVHQFETPVKFTIEKSNNPLHLLHTKSFDYFSILRKKLFWGLDLRLNNIKEDE